MAIRILTHIFLSNFCKKTINNHFLQIDVNTIIFKPLAIYLIIQLCKILILLSSFFVHEVYIFKTSCISICFYICLLLC